MNLSFDKTFSKSLNELPFELVIEFFEKINLKEYKKFIKLSKQFYFIYKKYFEEKVKRKYYKVNFVKKVTMQISRNGNLFILNADNEDEDVC